MQNDRFKFHDLNLIYIYTWTRNLKIGRVLIKATKKVEKLKTYWKAMKSITDDPVIFGLNKIHGKCSSCTIRLVCLKQEESQIAINYHKLQWMWKPQASQNSCASSGTSCAFKAKGKQRWRNSFRRQDAWKLGKSHMDACVMTLSIPTCKSSELLSKLGLHISLPKQTPMTPNRLLTGWDLKVANMLITELMATCGLEPTSNWSQQNPTRSKGCSGGGT